MGVRSALIRMHAGGLGGVSVRDHECGAGLSTRFRGGTRLGRHARRLLLIPVT